MITWEEFFEAKESGQKIEAQEELNNLEDLGDDEAGEPPVTSKKKIELKPKKSKKSKKA